ncbi:MAG: hypothetical protein GQ557_00435 [Mycoplasmataceae bacterium]|nr:hypothetical protein [Mycoplasmataceae bacterium]
MKKSLLFKIHDENTKYFLVLNEKKLDIDIWRIKSLKKYWSRLIVRKEIPINEGYFMYRANGFNSYLINETVDLIFVDWNDKVIKIYHHFETNKISPGIKGTKFLYILSGGNVKRKNIYEGDVLKHQRI